jgi:flagellar protein FlgJ
MNNFSISNAIKPLKTDDLADNQKKELEKLREACSDFESIFMQQMLKEMRKTVDKTSLTHGGQAEEIFSDLLDTERAKEMKVGLGDMLFSQLSQNIIKSNKPK